MNNIVKAVLANTPRRRMGAGIFGAAILAVMLLGFRPLHLHDGCWALIVLAALVWGFVELGHSAKTRPAVADAHSQLKLS